MEFHAYPAFLHLDLASEKSRRSLSASSVARGDVMVSSAHPVCVCLDKVSEQTQCSLSALVCLEGLLLTSVHAQLAILLKR